MFSKACHLFLAALALLALVTSFSSTSLSLGQSPVNQRPQPSQPATDTVTIQSGSSGRSPIVVSAGKSRVRVGELVQFTLSPAKMVTDAKHTVTVDFGDGTKRNTRQPVVTHRYRSTGHYKVYASVVSPVIEFGPQDPVSQRAIPRVTLSANPTSVDAGGAVTFNAQLSFSYPGIRYRFSFGDGSQTDWQDSSAANHIYRSAGSYPAFVDLGLNEGARIRQVGGSLRQSIVVNQVRGPVNPIDPKPPTPVQPDPQPGPVTLRANPTPALRGKPVTFEARASSTNSNVRYRFGFGDGSSSRWQNGAIVTHEYPRTGNFLATVNLGLIKNGRIRSLTNDSQRVQVNSTATTAVDFEANPTPVASGQQVSFNARATPAESNLRYRFVFGDSSPPTDWQTGPQASHWYPSAGHFSAHVEIGRWTNGRVTPIATSNPRTISVTDGAISSASPLPGQPSPNVSPGGSNSGTGTSTTGSSSPGGDESDHGPLGGADKWWLYLVLALLVAFVGYQTYRALLAPRTTFHPSCDPGSAEVDAAAKGLEINSQVLLRPNVSEAQYLVHSDDAIVRAVRRDNV